MQYKCLEGEFFNINSGKRTTGKVSLYESNYIEKEGITNIGKDTELNLIHVNGTDTIIDEGGYILGNESNTIRPSSPIWIIEDKLIKHIDTESLSGVELTIPLLSEYGHDINLKLKFPEDKSFLYFRKYVLTIILVIPLLLLNPIVLKYGTVKIRKGKNIQYTPFYLYNPYATGGVFWNGVRLFQNEKKILGIEYEESGSELLEKNYLYSIEEIGGVKGLDKLANELTSKENAEYFYILNELVKSMYYTELPDYDILISCELFKNILKLILKKKLNIDKIRYKKEELDRATTILYDEYLCPFGMFTSKEQFKLLIEVVQIWRNKVAHMDTLSHITILDKKTENVIQQSRFIYKIIFAIVLLKDRLGLAEHKLLSVTERPPFILAKKALREINLESLVAHLSK